MNIIRTKSKLIIISIVLSGAFAFFHFASAVSTSSQATRGGIKTVYSQRLPIFMYHYIGTPPAATSLPALYLSPQIFESQLKELRRYHFNPVFISEIARSLAEHKPLPPYSLALTFDDGYQDFYANAWPLLKKYRMKATVYVIVNRLDQPGYLTTSELKELASSGLVEIGSHTFNHSDLKTLKPEKASFEIAKSRVELEKIIDRPVPTFAYPFGRSKPEDPAIVKAGGYLGALSVSSGVEQGENDIWFLKRVRPNQRSGPEFAKWLFGLHPSKGKD